MIWLLLATLLAGTAVASSADFCSMSSGQPAFASSSTSDQVPMDHGTMDHDTMVHDIPDHGTDETRGQHGCCTGDSNDAGCMMNACLSMIATVAYQASPAHSHSILIFFPAMAVPQSPLFPLLRPPIA
ncbi:hypothetical protein CWI75_17895 [Kineobactrum sediminis]|uniref:CopL family metal-binding regulatory protein n=1 Tax=Kineobactrum sediminis TaxID=1905677 RepID=A0A2N5XXV3_9GAMM|nr:hypothetical protein CWI75_17895 [Kineobactrum sediminis]